MDSPLHRCDELSHCVVKRCARLSRPGAGRTALSKLSGGMNAGSRGFADISCRLCQQAAWHCSAAFCCNGIAWSGVCHTRERGRGADRTHAKVGQRTISISAAVNPTVGGFLRGSRGLVALLFVLDSHSSACIAGCGQCTVSNCVDVLGWTRPAGSGVTASVVILGLKR